MKVAQPCDSSRRLIAGRVLAAEFPLSAHLPRGQEGHPPADKPIGSKSPPSFSVWPSAPKTERVMILPEGSDTLGPGARARLGERDQSARRSPHAYVMSSATSRCFRRPLRLWRARRRSRRELPLAVDGSPGEQGRPSVLGSRLRRSNTGQAQRRRRLNREQVRDRRARRRDRRSRSTERPSPREGSPAGAA